MQYEATKNKYAENHSECSAQLGNTVLNMVCVCV